MRALAPAEPRVETGPLQFGDDWPGLFIRGDEALGLADTLNAAAAFLPAEFSAIRTLLNSVSELLGSCNKAE
jgi:hypothetical protein